MYLVVEIYIFGEIGTCSSRVNLGGWRYLFRTEMFSSRDHQITADD